MDEKPELIAFSQNKIGGVQNFYFNILTNDPYNLFDKKWIFTDKETETEAKLPKMYSTGMEILFPIYKNETTYQIANRLQRFISRKPGIALTNFYEELATLHIHRRNKTIFFICHDELYLTAAKNFEFLIDVFISHNIEFYEKLSDLFPQRKGDIYFIPYGVSVPSFKRKQNFNRELNIAILARLTVNKGVYDLPKIQDQLVSQKVKVKWTVIGDGPEKDKLKELMKESAVQFRTPTDNAEVMNILKTQDIYILPSRLEGLPVSMLEAMSVGCVPVISEFNQGIRKTLPTSVGFILPVGDIMAFSETIAALHFDREELEKRSILSRELIQKQFDIQSRAKEYFDLFKEYKRLKKSRNFRFFKYDGGFLHHPLIPRYTRTLAGKVKRFFATRSPQSS